MIPIGGALQTTGLSEVISNQISLYAENVSQFWLLFLILVVTMATTDIINNAATAVIMAPISAGIATATWCMILSLFLWLLRSELAAPS